MSCLPTAAVQIGPSLSEGQSQTLMLWKSSCSLPWLLTWSVDLPCSDVPACDAAGASLPGTGADNVTRYCSFGAMSRAWTPYGCGLKKVFTGEPDSRSQTTIMLSGPVSAVTIHFLSLDTAVAVIGFTWPCKRRCTPVL